MNRFLFSGILMLSTLGVIAQPSLTGSNNPMPWDVYASLPLDTASVQPGTPGVNQTWDFSSLVFIYNPLWDNYIYANSTSYAGFFPDANIASYTNTTSGEYIYHKLDAAGWEIHGYANNLYEFVYTDKQQVFTYPFTYNTVINDTYGGSTTHSGMTVTRTGTYFKKGVGYGSLVLPTGNFSNILLVETQNNYSDAYAASPPTTYAFSIREFAWHSPAYRFPLLFKYSMDVYIDGTLSSTLAVARVSTEVSGIDTRPFDDGSFAIYPQPASNILNLGFHNPVNGIVDIDCYNLSGQKIMDLHDGPVSGVLEFDISALAAGVYIMHIQSAERRYTRKFVVR